MENKNFQVVLDHTLDAIKESGKRPKLLLHSCCAPCSSYVLECLSNYFDITILYYNPNIYPFSEYERRRNELKRFIQEAKYPIEIIEKTYQDTEFYNAVRGKEHLGERSERCFACYHLRMKEACIYAKEHGFDYFTTTLSISPHKDSFKINEIGSTLEKEYEVSYLYADFKKKGGYLRSLELSKEYNLYRQDYCGCVYSKQEREKIS